MQSRTQEILSQFAKSWTETELYYTDLVNKYGFERLRPIVQFIGGLKEKGEDSYFRLGTSMDRLMISRSVDHGLRGDQKYIIIEAYDKSFEVALRDGDKTYREYMIEDLGDERLNKLLKTLKDTLVD